MASSARVRRPQQQHLGGRGGSAWKEGEEIHSRSYAGGGLESGEESGTGSGVREGASGLQSWATGRWPLGRVRLTVTSTNVREVGGGGVTGREEGRSHSRSDAGGVS